MRGRLIRIFPMYTHQPKRHPSNSKLRLHYGHTFRGVPVFQYPGLPLITNYLETTWRVLHDAMNANLRTLAIRLDLRYPDAMPVGPMHADNACLSRFFTALQQELKDAHTKYPPDLRYVWCREQNNSDKPHYHLLLLLNYDAFCSLGNFAHSAPGQYHRDNLYHRCVRAWQCAIGLHGPSPRDWLTSLRIDSHRPTTSIPCTVMTLRPFTMCSVPAATCAKLLLNRLARAYADLAAAR